MRARPSLYLPGVELASGLVGVRGVPSGGKSALLGAWAGEWLRTGARVGALDPVGLRQQIAAQCTRQRFYDAPPLSASDAGRLTMWHATGNVAETFAMCEAMLRIGHEAILLDEVFDGLEPEDDGIGARTRMQASFIRRLMPLLREHEALAIVSCNTRSPLSGGAPAWHKALATSADVLLSVRSERAYTIGGRLSVVVDKHRQGPCPPTTIAYESYGLDLLGAPGPRGPRLRLDARSGSLAHTLLAPRAC